MMRQFHPCRLLLAWNAASLTVQKLFSHSGLSCRIHIYCVQHAMFTMGNIIITNSQCQANALEQSLNCNVQCD